MHTLWDDTTCRLFIFGFLLRFKEGFFLLPQCRRPYLFYVNIQRRLDLSKLGGDGREMNRGT